MAVKREPWLTRSSGVLLPIFSLPGPGGIGCFSQVAKQFIDKLNQSQQKWWQILPLGVTGFGDSPYQSFSSFAGNPYFIDLKTLQEDGLLTEEELQAYLQLFPEQEEIDYGTLYLERYKILHLAFDRFLENNGFESEAYLRFSDEQKAWLTDFALFMTIKDSQGGSPWQDWPVPLRDREPEALAKAKYEQEKQFLFFLWTQFAFYTQWQSVLDYAHEKGIAIIGDLPIYAAADSADVWTNRDLFSLDEEGRSFLVSGCPPDAFAPEGQLWGNPIYKWEQHKETHYAWWKKRLRQSFHLYDCVRIDHFRGIESFYAIPSGAKTAHEGKWRKGPGLAFYEAVDPKGELAIIAEDLGYLTPEVRNMLYETGLPGMKIIEFAFDSRENENYLPYTYKQNSVVMTGTHDNDPLRSWYRDLDPKDKKALLDYLGTTDTNEAFVCNQLLNLSFGTVADLCITPLYDLLLLGSEARINKPSTVGDNWKWRVSEADFNDNFWMDILGRKTKIYGRA